MTSVIIRLQNLPMSANTSSIRRFFSGLNIPEGGVHIVGGDDGDAFIAFATDEDARKAMLLDRQLINGVTIRLFLSSKTEMQSVIETARSSIMLPPIVQAQQLPPSKPSPQELPHFTEKLAVSEYHSGTNQSYCKPSLPDSHMPYPFPQRPTIADSALKYTNSNYPEITPAKIPTINFSPEPLSTFRDNYNYQYDCNVDMSRSERIYPPQFQPQPILNIQKDDFSAPQGLVNPSERINVPMVQPNSLSDPKVDYGYSNYVERFSTTKPLEITNPPSLNNTTANPTIRPPIPFDTERSFNPSIYQTKPHHSEDYRQPEFDMVGKMQPNQYDHYQRDVPRNQERDFSIRPPWLGNEIPCLKRQGNVEHENLEDTQFSKRNRQSLDDFALDTNFVCKLSLRPSDVSVKTVFDILKGVNIIPRWGIRIEEDVLRRFTGHIYVMVNGREALERALGCNGFNYRGRAVEVVSSTPEEFFRVTDSNFQSKCPPEILKKLPPRSSTKPPYYLDACVELGDLPFDVTKEEVVSFLGAPGLSIFDVVIVSGRPSEPTTSAFVRLPSSNDLEILLRARPRPFRETLGVAVRLTPISRMQYLASETKSSGNSCVEENDLMKDSKIIRSSDLPCATNAEVKSCAFLSGFSRPMTNFEISKLFPSVIIPGDAIRIFDGNKSSLIDFISENNCLKAISDFKSTEVKLKELHPSLSFVSLSRSEFEQKLHESTVTDELDRQGIRQKSQPVFTDQDNRDFRPPPRENVRFPLRHPPPSTPEYIRYNHPPSQRPPFFDDQSVHPPNYPEVYPRRPEPFAATRPPRMPHPSMPPLSQRPDLPRGVSVYISNLVPMVSPEILMDVFRQYYPIPGSLRLRRDVNGQPMGDAAITFPSNMDADRAIRELNGYRLFGRGIVLRYERDPVRCE